MRYKSVAANKCNIIPGPWQLGTRRRCAGCARVLVSGLHLRLPHSCVGFGERTITRREKASLEKMQRNKSDDVAIFYLA